MKINRSSINFHETFQPEVAYLAKIVELAKESYFGKKDDISLITGIPTGKQKGKVEPHIKYASYMGLINYSIDKGVYTLSLTELGEEVFMQDKYLHENLTHWLCHYNISRPVLGAPQWNYIVHHGFTGFYQRDTSEHHLNRANKLFETNVSFEEMFGVVKRSYLDGFFSDLNYLNWSDTIEYVEHIERPELLFVYGYALFDLWLSMYPTQKEITFNELTQGMGIGKVFNLGESEVESVLESLADENLIKINRQLYPMTIIMLSSMDDIVPRLYSRLL